MRAYEQIVEQGGRVADTMRAFWTFLHGTDMMAPRLVELRRVLKPTGSTYLHCDPTATRANQQARIKGSRRAPSNMLYLNREPRRSST